MTDANNVTAVDSSENNQNPNDLHVDYFFPCPVYYIEKLEFLESVSAVSNEALEKIKKENPQPNEIYPVYQTGLIDDERIRNFYDYVGQTSWNILESQGFDMNMFNTVINEVWCQEHYKHSGHDEHVHGFGAQLVGFYFLEVPEDSSRVVFHDPRPGKKQINIMERDMNDVTIASSMVNFVPKAGTLMIANSWLPHSFTRNGSEKAMRFVHFTIGIQLANQSQGCPTESKPEII